MKGGCGWCKKELKLAKYARKKNKKDEEFKMKGSCGWCKRVSRVPSSFSIDRLFNSCPVLVVCSRGT